MIGLRKCDTPQHTHTYAQWNITQTIGNDEILPFTLTWVNLENHTKWSKSDRERQMWYHLYVEPKYQYKQTYI